MKRILSSLCLFASSFALFAQTSLAISGTIQGHTAADSLQLFMAPLNSKIAPTALLLEGEKIHGELSTQPSSIYNLTAIRQTSRGKVQLMLPVFLDEAHPALQLRLDGYQLQNLTDENNIALSSFAQLVGERAQLLWRHNNLAPETLRSLLQSYPISVDSILTQHAVVATTREYLRLWAYEQVLVGWSNRQRSAPLPYSVAEVLKDFHCNTDQALTLAFPPIVNRLLAEHRGKTLSEGLANLHEHFQNPELRQTLTHRMVENFVLRFPYKDRYEEGLTELQAATQRFALSESHLQQFKLRRATLPGTPFPKVKLIDAAGKAVDFAQFRGSYVYIDLWASWCAPCVREIPHLQALEHSLQNPKVKFVSISIDKDERAWREKMKQLKLSGHQYLAQGNGLTEALNISGIPHFLIYDPDGRLLVYKALRPSAGEELKSYLEGLK